MPTCRRIPSHPPRVTWAPYLPRRDDPSPRTEDEKFLDRTLVRGPRLVVELPDGGIIYTGWHPRGSVVDEMTLFYRNPSRGVRDRPLLERCRCLVINEVDVVNVSNNALVVLCRSNAYDMRAYHYYNSIEKFQMSDDAEDRGLMQFGVLLFRLDELLSPSMDPSVPLTFALASAKAKGGLVCGMAASGGHLVIVRETPRQCDTRVSLLETQDDSVRFVAEVRVPMAQPHHVALSENAQRIAVVSRDNKLLCLHWDAVVANYRGFKDVLSITAANPGPTDNAEHAKTMEPFHPRSSGMCASQSCGEASQHSGQQTPPDELHHSPQPSDECSETHLDNCKQPQAECESHFECVCDFSVDSLSEGGDTIVSGEFDTASPPIARDPLSPPYVELQRVQISDVKSGDPVRESTVDDKSSPDPVREHTSDRSVNKEPGFVSFLLSSGKQTPDLVACGDDSEYAMVDAELTGLDHCENGTPVNSCRGTYQGSIHTSELETGSEIDQSELSCDTEPVIVDDTVWDQKSTNLCEMRDNDGDYDKEDERCTSSRSGGSVESSAGRNDSGEHRRFWDMDTVTWETSFDRPGFLRSVSFQSTDFNSALINPLSGPSEFATPLLYYAQTQDDPLVPTISEDDVVHLDYKVTCIDVDSTGSLVAIGYSSGRIDMFDATAYCIPAASECAVESACTSISIMTRHGTVVVAGCELGEVRELVWHTKKFIDLMSAHDGKPSRARRLFLDIQAVGKQHAQLQRQVQRFTQDRAQKDAAWRAETLETQDHLSIRMARPYVPRWFDPQYSLDAIRWDEDLRDRFSELMILTQDLRCAPQPPQC